MASLSSAIANLRSPLGQRGGCGAGRSAGSQRRGDASGPHKSAKSGAGRGPSTNVEFPRRGDPRKLPPSQEGSGSMNRRTVLKAGMGGLVGVAAMESGCATAPARLDHAPVDPEAAEAAIARFDARMASFAHLDFDIPKDVPHHVRATLETKAELARKTFRALYLAGAFQQLDESLQYHPGVQERVRRMQGEMDATVHHVTEHLASLSPAERKQIQQQLAAHPEMGPSLSEHIQDATKEDGFRLGQRAQLRYAFSDLERRMRTQSASAVIDRSVERSRAARARPDRMGEGFWAAQMGEVAFRDLKQRAFAHAARWEHVYAARPRFD